MQEELHKQQLGKQRDILKVKVQRQLLGWLEPEMTDEFLFKMPYIEGFATVFLGLGRPAKRVGCLSTGQDLAGDQPVILQRTMLWNLSQGFCNGGGGWRKYLGVRSPIRGQLGPCNGFGTPHFRYVWLLSFASVSPSSIHVLLSV